MSLRVDVCIIGGGAAGLAAAASIDRGIRTCVIEKNKILGRKILATGGGRCNLTNAGCQGHGATLDFFASHGLQAFPDEEGRYYPYSGRASDVVRTLEDAVSGADCRVLTDCAAESIEVIDGVTDGGTDGGTEAADAGFRVRTSRKETVFAKAVLLAAGGKAAPQFGTTGDGYRLAKDLGHHVTRLYPILTGIRCGELKDLKGIRARGRVTLLKDGAALAQESGEIQFTEDGISGICVFNLTPLIRAEDGEAPQEAFKRYCLELDLAPDFTAEEIAGRTSSFGILTRELADRVDLEHIKAWRLPVLGIKGWRDAQCTAGGILLEEIHRDTMESALIPGLYFAGEILDIQGPCGGYNLQNAWETGMRAAKAISRQIREGRSLQP